jgi:uncharacterized protein (DUF885 family)
MKTRIYLVLILLLLSGCGTPRPTEQPEAQPSVTTPVVSGTQPIEATPIMSEEPNTQSPGGALAAKLDGLSLDEFFEVSWRELSLRNPEGVLADGVADIYGLEGAELTDISDAYVRETQQMYVTILDMLHEYNRDRLTPEQRISYDVYEWYLDDRVRQQEFMYHDYPATYYFVTSVPEDLIQFFTELHPVASKQDAEDYVTRLGQVNIKFEQLLEGLKLREETGVVPPRFAIQWALYSWRNLASANADDTPFYQALEEKLDALSGVGVEEKKALLESAEAAIDASVLPAFQALVEYLEYQESIATTDDGVWKLPNGGAYYAYTLRHHTTTDLTADEIHELGLRELECIHAEMRVIFDELGYPQDESLPDLFDRVARDGGQVSGNQVVQTYEALIEEADRSLDEVFDIRPRAKVIVIGAPYGGYYVSGAYDGSRPGAFYAGVSGAGEALYSMPSLAYHEAIPGHHWQISIAQESSLPAFRTAVGFTGYAEGWALYAERLAWELGWYDDNPYGNLGRLQYEAFRAARLVIDTGIHAKGWTFDQAVEYLTENVGYERGDPVNPEHEVARYIVWPGQATSYKIGMIKMLELRQRAMDQLGDRFDLKEFHNVVLSNGSMPLQILEQVVDGWIEETLSQATPR